MDGRQIGRQDADALLAMTRSVSRQFSRVSFPVSRGFSDFFVAFCLPGESLPPKCSLPQCGLSRSWSLPREFLRFPSGKSAEIAGKLRAVSDRFGTHVIRGKRLEWRNSLLSESRRGTDFWSVPLLDYLLCQVDVMRHQLFWLICIWSFGNALSM